MPAVPQNLRTAAVALAALFLGYSARAFLHPHLDVVEAQSRSSQSHEDANNALAFQLSGLGPATTLTVFSPSDHTLYVYPSVTQGNSHVNCSYMLHITRPGAAIERQNCAAGAAY